MTHEITRQALATEGRSRKLAVTGRLKTALELMVWQGKARDEAASESGLKDHSLRAALKKPHVKTYYAAELEALRTGERARNVHALVDVRDNSKNSMARVAAAKGLEETAIAADRAPLGAGVRTPGIVIQIVGGSVPPAGYAGNTIEHVPSPSQSEAG